MGTKVWFKGYEPEVEVLSIDEQEGSWIGSDCDGYHKYPLDEGTKHWKQRPKSNKTVIIE